LSEGDRDRDCDNLAVPATDQPWTPDKKQLEKNFSDLRQLVERPVPRLTKVLELRRVAELLCPSLTGLDGIRAVVQLAVDYPPQDDWADIAALLYGLTEQTMPSTPVNTRRDLAYHLYLERAGIEPENFSKETFRTGREPQIIEDLADALVELVAAFYKEQVEAVHTASTAPLTPEIPAVSTPATAPPDAASHPAIPALQPQVIKPDPEQRPPLPRHRWLAALALCSIVGAVALVAALASGHGTPRHCGATTARLVNLSPELTTPEVRSRLYIYAPHQYDTEHGWASTSLTFKVPPKEVFHFDEVRTVALAHYNEANEPEPNVIARASLSQGAALQPDSTCIYRGSSARSGTSSAGTSLIGSTGLNLGTIAPHTAIYVTVNVVLPKPPHETSATIYGAIGPAGEFPEPNWYEQASSLQVPLTR
jgi:hypothetical protein